MKERPIIFSTPMVRAILDGRKTQTRRIFKHNLQNLVIDKIGYTCFTPEGFISVRGQTGFDEKGYAEWFVKCPYGQPSDRLWVRETWANNEWPIGHPYEYKATAKEDGSPEEGPWKPSIHMPRKASRILLEITDIRVERLNEISEQDAIAEGAPNTLTISDMKGMENSTFVIPRPFLEHQFGFMALWCKINGVKSWDSNPWVWVITFKRL